MKVKNTYSYDVFISYRWVSPDLEWVREQLYPALVGAGLKVCMDVEDFIPGRDLMLEMKRAGMESHHVVCVISPSYFEEGRMVEFESLFARRRDPSGRHSHLIPLIFRETEIPEWVRGLIPVDWTISKNWEREWKKLLSVLNAPYSLAPHPDHQIVLKSSSGVASDSQSLPNPFVWRNGITAPEDFFNRDNEQAMIHAYLHKRQNCQIVGPRRIGKTSLLKQIERVAKSWKRGALVAYLDLQDARCSTFQGWLKRVCDQFRWPTPIANMSEFSEAVEKMIQESDRPILCLDEFEEFNLRRSEFTREFFSSLRACSQQGMSIVTASQKSLSQLTDPGAPSSPFYNTFPIIRLGHFSQAEAEDFVALHRSGIQPFTTEEQKAIIEFAKGHPLALQIACYHILQLKQTGITTVFIALERAADDIKNHLHDS